MTDPPLRNCLRATRARLGLAQAEFALQVGVSRKTIDTGENGVFVLWTTLVLRLREPRARWRRDCSDCTRGGSAAGGTMVEPNGIEPSTS